MTDWPQDALEAIYTLARAVHDVRPEDKAVTELLTEAEYEMHMRKDDPAQLRAHLDFMGGHANALAGSA